MITPEEKTRFLALLRSGVLPPEAAIMVNPEYTGSTFRRITNEQNPNYDPDFSADYLRARAEGRQHHDETRMERGKPRTTTLAGHVKALYLTDEMLDSFLEAVSDGVPLKQAADQIEPKTTLTQITRRANKDPEFAERYADAKQQGYPQFQEKLRHEIVRMAYNGDYRAARDLALIHLPEFKPLTTSRHEITGGAEIKMIAQRALPELPPEQLEELIRYMEKKQKQLPPPDVEAA